MRTCDSKYRVTLLVNDSDVDPVVCTVTACDKTHAAQKVATDPQTVWRDWQVDNVSRLD